MTAEKNHDQGEAAAAAEPDIEAQITAMMEESGLPEHVVRQHLEKETT